MPKDLFTLKKTIPLFAEVFTGAKVNRIIEPSSDELVFTLYNKKTFNVVISTQAKFARISLSTQNYKAPLVAPNFCMLLRKYLLGGTITSVKVNDVDRIVSIDFSCENDFKEFKNYSLNVEIMGKYSNVFLTSDGILLGALKNSSQNFEKGRILLSGAKYLFPLAQDKIDPYNEEEAKKVLALVNYQITANFILNNFLGFAPVTAEEIAYLINLKCEKQGYSADLAYLTLKEFLDKPLRPVIIKSEEYSDVLPFDYEHLLGEREQFDNFLEAEEIFYTSSELKFKLQGYKNTLLSKIYSFKKKEEKKLSILNNRITEANSYEKYRLYGELIISNLYRLEKGLTYAEVENYYSENYEKIKIPLDKELHPKTNAERYFKKYNKLKKSLEITTEQIVETESELEYANRIEYTVNASESVVELEEIEKELKLQGFIKNTDNKTKQNKKVSASANALTYNVFGYVVKVGKNNLQNEALLDEASRTDIWLHVKDYHSSFVIIKAENKEVPNEVLQVSAEICAYRSEAKNGSKVMVDITKRKFVKKPPKSRPGSVIYTDYTTVNVEPKSHSDKILN